MTDNASNNTSPFAPSQREVDTFVRAARTGHIAAIQRFLDEYGAAFINQKDAFSKTALMEAAWRGKTIVLKELLKNNADPEVKDKNGKTALMLAAWSGYKEEVILLLAAGADIRTRDNTDKTALIMAAIGNSAKTALPLLESGASPEEKDNNNYTALWWAEQLGHSDVVAVFDVFLEAQKQQRAAAGLSRQQAEKDAARATAAVVEARVEKLKNLRPARPALKKPGI